MPGVPDTAITIQHLNLDNKHHSNPHFSNWTLRNDIIHDQQILPLSSPVALNPPEDLDYVHARYDALRNHITTQPQGHYFFQTVPAASEATSSTAETAITLNTLKSVNEGHITVQPICTLNELQLPSNTKLIESQLHPSVVEVTTTEENDNTIDAQSNKILLVSSGKGEIRALSFRKHIDGDNNNNESTETNGYSISNEVYPMRPIPPLQGVRPVHLEAAMMLPGGNKILVVCWAVGSNQSRSGSVGGDSSGGVRRSAVCEVYAVILKLVASLGQLEVVRVDLLQVQ